MVNRLCLLLSIALLMTVCGSSSAQQVPADRPIRVVIVGLVHGHVGGFLHALPENHDATLVGIVEPDTALASKYRAQYKLDPTLFHTDL